jgi:DNA mismatch repair protein MutS
VTRLITPGTLVDDALLDTSKPNYLACVSVASWRTATLRFGLALADVCTGELRATDGEGLDALERCLRAAQPAELLLAAGADGRLLDGADSLLSSPPSASRAGLGDVAALARRAGVPVVTGRPSPDFAVPRCNAELCSRFSVDNVESLGCRGRDEVVSAVGALLSFVSGTVEVDGRGRVPFCRPALFSPRDCLEMDEAALRNLEVVETMRGGSSGKSLRWAVDRTVTAMGARRVRSWLLAPLTDVDAIMYRQRIVVRLARDGELRSTLSEQLRGVADLERLAGRVGGDRASPRELQRLAQSLVKLPDVRDVLSSAGGDASPFAEIVGALGHGAPPSAAVPSASPESMDGLGRVIVDALVDPAPSALLSTPALAHLVSSTPGVAGHEAGRVFRAGYCAELDLLRASESDPAKWIAAFEEQEQERTGVSSLRVKRLRNSGYVIRVARSVAERRLERDPASFSDVGYERTLSTKSEMRFRSATLAAREREEEAMVRAVGRLEWDLFHALLLRVGRLTDGIRKAAAGVAELDALLGFARLSSEQNYVAPIVEPGPSRVLHIVDGRHPVVELNLAPGRTYVPNSFRMGTLRDECGDVGPAAATAAAEAAAVVADADDLPACDEMILCGPNASCVHMCLPPLALLRASRM